MRTRHFGYTDTGRRRKHNEDAWLGDEKLGLFVVCDGVGGRARGEVASEETVELIWDWVKGQAQVVLAAIAEAESARAAAVANGPGSAAAHARSPGARACGCPRTPSVASARWSAVRCKTPATWSTAWARSIPRIVA
jgi:hypothetical protein